MKKLHKILFFISIVTVSLTSCSSDDNEVKVKNFIKTIETTENGVSENSIYIYNGNQIMSTENSKERLDYTYDNGLITKIIKYNKQTQLSSTLDYTYLDNKLVKVISSDRYVIYYNHQNNGTVLYEKYKIDAQNQELELNHGTLFFSQRNLIKIERFYDNVSEGTLASSKTTYEYDNYNNPYYSILGYDKLLDHGVSISKSNVVLTIQETTVANGDETITSANLYKTIYKYDIDKYPTEQVSESSLGNPNYLKIEYLY